MTPTIEQEIAALGDLDLAGLRERWAALHASPAPVRMSREVLIGAIAYRMQEQAFGGLSPATLRMLRGEAGSRDGARGGSTARPSDTPAPAASISAHASAHASAPASAHASGRVRTRIERQVGPGTRLLRQWQGRTIEVVAQDDGSFLHEGRRHASLSAIARAVTGTRWSGPAFFGLAGERRLAQAGAGAKDGKAASSTVTKRSGGRHGSR